MADYTKAQVGRASAVLTTGEVAGATLDVSRVKNREVTVDLSFTIGSLTNVTVRHYSSVDGTTFDIIREGVSALSEALTASTETMYTVKCPKGVNFFRTSVQGSGTVTSSLCDFTYRYDRLGAP